jgi:hypothetical protein
MIWILSICVWVLVILCVVLVGRVRKLQNDLVFWRNEAIRLNNEKPTRGKDGRFAKKIK